MSTRPRITFDQEGRCNACQWSDEKKTFNWKEREEELKKNLKKYTNASDNYKVMLRNNQKPKKKSANQSNKEEASETAGGQVQENADENQDQCTQGAHIIVNNDSLGRKSYTIDQMLGAHPIDHPIWNLNSTMSDKEEDVNKDKLLQKIDHLAITENDQDFQSDRR